MNTAQDRKKTDHNGYWYIEDNPISRAGVFQYLGSQISEELEPDRLYNVYRPAEELFNPEAMKSFELIPFVNDHEMLGKGQTPAEEYGVHGVLGEKIGRKGDMLTADIKIYSEALKDEINNGKKELSLGYYCDYDLTPGTYKGQHYDAVQRNLRGNHIALVDKGRMGHDVRVMDGFAWDSLELLANDDSWITVKPNGPEHKGQHVQISESGEIKSGMGGKFNGLHIGMVAQGRNESKKEQLKAEKKETQKIEPAKIQYPQKQKSGNYRFSDFEVKRETEKAYMISKAGYSGWIPKKGVKKDGEISSKFTQEIENGIKRAERKENAEKELGSFKFWTPIPNDRQIYNKQRIYFPDGSYAERQIKYFQLRSDEGKYELSSEFTRYPWVAESGEAKEKLEKINKVFPQYPAEDTTNTTDFSGETEAQAAAKEKEIMDKRELIREIAALSAKDPAEFKGGTEEKVKAVTELAETLAYGDGKEDKPEGDDITTAPPEEEEKKTETETETETEIKTENENKEEDAAKCDAEPQAVQGTRLEIKALPPEKDDVVKKAADMAAEKVSKNIYEMQELKARITPHIGEFDSSKMRSVADMADYALRKMGKKAKGDKVAYLEGCLSNMKPEGQMYGMAADSANDGGDDDDTIAEVLKGVK